MICFTLICLSAHGSIITLTLATSSNDCGPLLSPNLLDICVAIVFFFFLYNKCLTYIQLVGHLGD